MRTFTVAVSVALLAIMSLFQVDARGIGASPGKGGGNRPEEITKCNLVCTTKPDHKCEYDDWWELGATSSFTTSNWRGENVKSWSIQDKYRDLAFTGVVTDGSFMRIISDGTYAPQDDYYVGYGSGNNIDWYKITGMTHCSVTNYYGYNSLNKVTVRQQFAA
ncbi:hypothetical protein CBS101457_004945 [Exobasidium rhododendri]|nr:hypothetical protein CBS101457_004945 [Exobasidium rhododendri]